MSGKGKQKDKGKKERKIEISERVTDNEPPVEEAAVGAGQAEPTKPSVEQELEELRGRFQRLAADYQNYQKRSYKQIEQAGQYAREEIAKSMLVVLDNFEHTLAKGSDVSDATAVLEGVKIVYDHLQSVLTGHGVTRIEVRTGDPFDPNLHEAMLHEESDECREGTVLRELAAGYTMGGRTLRPAKVSVAKGSTKEKECTNGKEREEKGKNDADV